MALSVTLTDLGNNTGATATIAGSDGGSNNDVYTQNPRSGAWTLSGSRTGDGAVTLGLARGLYWAYVAGEVGGSPAVSPVTSSLTAVTRSGDESIQEQLMNAVVAGIQAISPTVTGPTWSLSASRVYKQKVGAPHPNMTYPAVVVCAPVAETIGGGDNLREDYGHPVAVLIVNKSSIDNPDDIPDFTLARDRIIKYFISQHLQLTGIQTMTCTVEAGPIFNPPDTGFHETISTFTLRFRVRETRGV